ncbi:MAG: UDP-N-acetylmuramate dehydrogenase [Lachnospiraceae bacterium]|nr:UDP-N-acetylmuramate dehydrogenase [Lachnospiraceae bacterium]
MNGLSPDIIEYIKTILPEDNIHADEPMSAHTTFRTGGPAKLLVEPETPEEIMTLLSYLKQIEEPFFIKGNGSNLLVSDRGYDGVIIELNGKFSGIERSDRIIRAKAGAHLSAIAKEALDASLTGFEFASGIPGTLGGGVVMNAGAYGGELKDVIRDVTVLDGNNEILTLPAEDMEFGYRTSIIRKRPFTVLEASIELTEGDREEIREKTAELNRMRREKQPLEYPSAGSTFKRPEGYFAGELIMDAGLRGFSVGGAAVSEKHCGFVINKGRATSEDIREVILEVTERVFDRFGVRLEPEIVFLGAF